MTRISMFLVVFVLLISSCSGDKKPEYEKIRYERYIIPAEGAYIEMEIDSITPLNELIDSLEYNTELYETGKEYWIGYNDLMYSIAVYSDEAIAPLLNFIKKSSNIEARYAACYTLHFIGIRCRVVGRFREEFYNKKVREALLSLLTDGELQSLVMELLVRDPWVSDIPVLINTMDKLSSDCWAMSKGLLLYGLEKDIPFELHVPDSIKKLYVQIPDIKRGYTKQEFINAVFKTMKDVHSEIIVVEDTLLSYNFRYDPINLGYVWDLGNELERKRINASAYRSKVSVSELIDDVYWMGYSDIRNNYLYTMQEGRLYLISANTAKKMWLDWWGTKSGIYKKDLIGKDYSQRKFHSLQLDLLKN